MSVVRFPCFILLALACAGAMSAQEGPVPQLLPGSARKPAAESAQTATPQLISLTVPKGASLQVALDREVRVKTVGRPIHARVVEPVYAFDRLVVPVGSEVVGEVTKVGAISPGKRTLSVLNADFTPARAVEIGFKELILPDGKRLPLHTSVTGDSGQVIQLVTSPETKDKKGIKDKASEKTEEAKQQAKQKWEAAMKQLKTPGRVHRLERYAEAQLPVHAQYIPAGTVYFAELDDPLEFGSETMTPQMASSLGGELPEDCVVHARLITPLSSATAHKGEAVEAVLSQPLFDGDRLALPQGSRLKGTVRQVEPARRLKKNGQLRIAFLELIPPDGIEQKVHATLEGVQAGRDAHVKLDSEGGAEATTSKSRYLATAVSLGLAAASLGEDHDAVGGGSAGNANNRIAGGAAGFKLVGMVAGALVHSRAFGYTMGAYGAGMSVYSHFIARGQEVVFPKNTAMEIGIGTRPAAGPPSPSVPPANSGSDQN
jgi:type IV secretory pathway VirB10-like protein